MSPMTLKHTVSPSGKTHRLTDPKTGQFVQLQYQSKPQFADQVQGDLIRKYSREIFPVVIGRLDWSTDPTLLDKGQKAPSLDYLRGYFAGLNYASGEHSRAIEKVIRETREQIAKLEAQQTGVSISEIAYGGPTQGPPPAAGAASVVIDQVQVNNPSDAEIARRDLMRRRAERGGR